ncbi:hypothetical protein [Paenibacillus lutimineralis]|uniref:Uncharacterized protein n=1 Tax=Paenibacillus lutimineralis TaxID=2707005 RepID=A0A3Q9IAL4_9BACL|nr:hypothetical protein [Paenibacillus lutimineralis]AZS16459.1 hypothetical protein EI981_19725 [Paenibacillus lutimineralis]
MDAGADCRALQEDRGKQMNNATVTIDYESFQSIKVKADKYDKAKREQLEASKKHEQFVESLCTSLEKANECETPEQKQYYIALGIRAICEHYGMDLKTEYGDLDEGEVPETKQPVKTN